MRKMICIGLAAILLVSSLDSRVLAAPAALQAPTNPSKIAALRKKVASIDPGTKIEVKFLNKEKLRGRMGAISEEGFALQMAGGGEQEVLFGNVQSVDRTIDQFAKKLLIGLGVGGAVFVAIAIVCVTQGCEQ